MAGKLSVSDLQGFNEAPVLLGKSTVEKIRRAVEKLDKIPENTLLGGGDNLHQAPEVYIARVPDTGIPGLGEGDTGTASDDAPGSEECDIYKIDDNDDLVRVGTLSKTVYNLSTKKISERWIPVFRDKFGKWLAIGPQRVATRFYFTANGSKTRQQASVAVTPLYMINGDNPGSVTAHDPGIGFTASSGSLGIAVLCEDGTYRIEWIECDSNVDVGTGT